MRQPKQSLPCAQQLKAWRGCEVAELVPVSSEIQVKVTKRIRWGSIPEPLTEDLRLSLCTRAVAVWLTIKPDGWIVRISVLLHRVGCSKDLWQRRVAPELEAAGYLLRHRRHNEKGQIRWSHEFFPDADALTSTMTGFSGDGLSSDGKSYQLVTTPSKINQTPPPARTRAAGTATSVDTHQKVVVGEHDVLPLPSDLAESAKKQIHFELATLPAKQRNAVTAEFIAQRPKIKNSVGWMRAVCARVRATGEFLPANTSLGGAGKPWFLSASGIELKGKELGIAQGDEIFPVYSARVLAAAGVNEAAIKAAKRDYA